MSDPPRRSGRADQKRLHNLHPPTAAPPQYPHALNVGQILYTRRWGRPEERNLMGLAMAPSSAPRANVTAKTSKGETPLMIAAESGSNTIVDLLLSRGANRNAKNSNGETALIKAVKKEHLDTARLLLQRGANPNMVRNDELTPLMLAVNRNNLDIIRLLLEYHANPNLTHTKDYGNTALMKAAQKGNLEAVHALVEGGANLHIQRSRDGMTALHVAAEKPNTQGVVRFLIEWGANINKEDYGGNTPLLLAARWGRPENVFALLDAGANVNHQNHEGPRGTPLVLTVFSGNPEAGEIARALLARHARADYRSEGYDFTLLHYALRYNFDLVKALVDGGADVNAIDELTQTTPLMSVARQGRYDRDYEEGDVEIVEYLLLMGADKNLKNSEGKTALQLVKGKGPNAERIRAILRGTPAATQPPRERSSRYPRRGAPPSGGRRRSTQRRHRKHRKGTRRH